MIRKNELYGNTFQMEQYMGEFTSDLTKYHRTSDFGEVTFNIINSASLNWDKDQDNSFFGFQPYWYPNVGQEKASNFIRQMQDQGKLSSITISFDIRSEFGHTSFVKFGGYDAFAIEGGKEAMKLFKTLSIDTWVFPLDRINNMLG